MKQRRFAQGPYVKGQRTTASGGAASYPTGGGGGSGTALSGLSYAQEVNADNPDGYWRLTETSGTTFASQGSGSPPSLTSVNSPTLGETGPIPGGKAVRLNRDDIEYLKNDPPHADLGRQATQFTCEAWIKPESVDDASTCGIMGSFNGAVSQRAFMFGLLPSRQLAANISKTGTGGYQKNGTKVLNLDQWYHVALTYDAGTVAIYIDGVQDATGASGTHNKILNYTQPFLIGSNWTYNAADFCFDGWIAEPAFFESKLSAARILAHYQARSTVATA